MKNLTEAQEQLRDNGGFSYSLTFGDLAGTPNYSIGVAKELEQIFNHLPTDAEVSEYVNKNITLLAQEKYFLGGWEHKGQYYLDVAQALRKDRNTEGVARRVGLCREQIAIFDLETMTEINCITKK